MIRRLYSSDNCPKLIAFGKKQHEKLGYTHPYSPRKCEMLLRGSFMAPDRAVWGAFDGKKVTGVLIGAIEPYPFMEGDYVTDIIFVAERDGASLYRSLIQWGKAHGAKGIQLGVTSGSETADAFYEKVGLKKVGSIFVGEV